MSRILPINFQYELAYHPGNVLNNVLKDKKRYRLMTSGGHQPNGNVHGYSGFPEVLQQSAGSVVKWAKLVATFREPYPENYDREKFKERKRSAASEISVLNRRYESAYPLSARSGTPGEGGNYPLSPPRRVTPKLAPPPPPPPPLVNKPRLSMPRAVIDPQPIATHQPAVITLPLNEDYYNRGSRGSELFNLEEAQSLEPTRKQSPPPAPVAPLQTYRTIGSRGLTPQREANHREVPPSGVDLGIGE
ncbi:MAG: hypothetical protein GY869_30370, partial [Planctomycetes bacterium]|nr:hypothetical protein [Planctomycetota bacterium]